MGTTVYVGVVSLVELRQSVDDTQRLLGGSTVVKPYEVVAVHLLIEHGELSSYLVRVEHVSLLIVEVLHQLCLRYAYAEAILTQHRLGIAQLHIVAIEAWPGSAVLSYILRKVLRHDVEEELAVSRVQVANGT